MLKDILTVSGKSGLFQLVARGKNSLILEPIKDGAGKRFPLQGTDKVVTLGDISIFTDEGEMPLRIVFQKFEEAKGKEIIDPSLLKADNATLLKFFGEIIPDFDRERVYPSHIKKMITWYNCLVDAGKNDFSEEEQPAATEAPAAE